MPSRAETIRLADNSGLNRGTVIANNSTLLGTLTEQGDAVYHRTRYDFTGTLTLSDTGSVNGAQANIPIYTYPTGLIKHGGGAGSLTLTRNATSTAGTTSATAAFVVAMGSAAAANTNATLTGTEADIIPSTAYTLSGGTKGQSIVGSGATSSFIDGTTTSGAAFLNVAVPSANNTGNNTITISGVVMWIWEHAGTIS